MRRRRKQGIAVLLLALCVTLGLLPALTVTAGAAGVSYLDASGATQTAASATSVTADDTAWNAGWYVVDSNVTNSNRITVSGAVNLILADGYTLTASAGIGVNMGDSLTIYGQTNGTGALNATGGQYDAGIGGTYEGLQNGGVITINGGVVTANGTNGAGIGGSSYGSSGTITINGGKVTASNGYYAAAIGGGDHFGSCNTVTINGGEVTVFGHSGIGGGDSYQSGTLILNWTNETDSITVSNYNVTSVTMLKNFIVDGDTTATVLTPTTILSANGKKIVPHNIDITLVSLEQSTLNLTAGGSTETLTATVSPDNASDKTVTWASDNTAVATVDSSGVVTPVAAGTATITVTATNGTTDTSDDKTATCTVTVAAVPVDGVTLAPTTLTLTVGGSTATLTATVSPDNATDKTVTWASDNTAVATVSNGVVTPVAAGTATITVTATNGTTATSDDKSATCAVTVIPSYAVTMSDGKTTETKYHYGGEDITLSVIVSGADFEGGEFTLKYDSDTLEVKTYPTGNKFADSVQTAGSVQFELLNKEKLTDGDALATITFKVKTPVTTETECKFEFSTDNPPKICYDTDKDSVEAATVTDGSVIVEPVTYAVTLTGADGVTFVNSSNETITTDTAVDGQAFTAQMGAEFDAANYVYTVTLKIGGAEVTPAPTPDSDGKITIPAEKVTIADAATDKTIVLTVGRTLGNFTVTTTADYVTGWTLVTIAKAEGRTDNPVYNYDGNAAYYVEAYNAYAYLVEGAVTVDDAKTKVSLGTSAAGTIAAGYDVNNTGKVDYSDALLTYRCYVKAYQTPATAMETYLRADVDNSKKVDTTDVSAIDENRTPET